MSMQNVSITLVCTHFPGRSFDGYDDLQVGLQVGRGQAYSLEGRVPGDSTEARFTVALQARRRAEGTVDFSGPLVQGKPGEHFLYLTWISAAHPQNPLRRVKVPLWQLSWDDLQNGQIVAHLHMTGTDGGPLAATPKLPYLRWEIA
ncbi:MAG: hypothetical protein IT328_13080 [Caldilineaceae bacterium]|nr:hypothetical protein [Caldilineaceae bacterium]